MTAPYIPDQGLGAFLEKTKSFLQQELHKAPELLQEPLKKIGLKGKGLRSTVLYLCSEGCDLDRLYPIAAALELLHLASMIHDDLIDGADLRRSEPSMHKSSSSAQAILLGDLLFAQVFGLIAETLSQEHAIQLSQVVRTMIYAEILQYHRRYDTKLSPRQYKRIIAGKTAGLFAMAAEIGGHLAEASFQRIAALRKGGYAMGMGFQIQDDFLDLWGTQTQLGKPTLQDWKQGQYGYPLVLGFKEIGQPLAKALKNEQEEEILMILEEGKVSELTEDEIQKYYRKAEDCWRPVFSPRRRVLAQKLLSKIQGRKN